MQEWLSLLYVGPQQALPVAVALVLWIGLAGLGYLVTPKGRIVEAAPFVGWGIVSIVFTLVGVVVAQPLFVLTILAGLGALAGLALAGWRREPVFVPGSWRIAVLALPLLVIVGAMAPSQWDEFSHWLPAARFLLRNEGFATSSADFGGFIGYPYGWPLLMYLGARIAGGFVETIGGQLNLLMLLSFAAFALRHAFAVVGRPRSDTISWPFAAAVALTATALNPTFVQKIVFTAYSDVSSAVTTGLVILLGYHVLGRTAERDRPAVDAVTWQFALVLALLVNIRQSNAVIAAAVLVGLAVVAWRDPQLSLARIARTASLAVLPALAVYGAWRLFVASLPAGEVQLEAGFMPLSQWDFAIVPAMLASIADIWFKKAAFFVPMLIACAFAARALVRCVTALDRIALLTAIVFAANTLFLCLAYVGHHGGLSGAKAISYWRYNIDIGMVATIFLTTGVLWWWSRRPSFDRYPRWLAPAAIAAVIVLPIALAGKIRFDLEPPKPYFTRVAKDLATSGIAENVYLADPTGTGEAAVITRYYLDQPGVAWLSAFHDTTEANVTAYLARVRDGEYLLVHSLAPGMAEQLPGPLDGRHSYLFKRERGGWSRMRDWAKPADHRW